MITHWAIPVIGMNPNRVKPAYLHAVASSWMEDTDRHHARRKDWSVTPMINVDGVDAVHVVALTAEASNTLGARSLGSSSIRLGSQNGYILTDPIALESFSYDDVLNAPVDSAHVVEFLTPTALRDGSLTSPFLEPLRLARSAVSRWSSLVGDDLTLDADAARGTWVSDIEGHNDVLKLHSVTVSGFVGRMRFVHQTDGAAELFSRIWAFAEHAGVGAYTAAGLGCIALASGWQHEQSALASASSPVRAESRSRRNGRRRSEAASGR